MYLGLGLGLGLSYPGEIYIYVDYPGGIFVTRNLFSPG